MVQNSPLYFTPPEDNEWLKQTSDAVKKQTQDELENISKSYGFAVMMGSRKVFMPFATYYQRYIDAAIMDVISGSFDYNSVIRRVVTQMVNSGLRTVDYASGHSSRVDVAVRRSILTGVSQITGKINERNASELDTEYFEVDWHPAARPDHQKWQGKVYSRDELRSVCGLGTVTGLCGANCRHTYYPFIPGVSERLYTDEWLEGQNRKEAKTKEWQGKELNAYEQTQQQRKMETAMRAQREKVQLLKEAGADKDDIMIARAKYQAQLDEYGRYCKRMGLPEQRERIYQDMRGRVATNTRAENARYTPEMLRNADKDSKLYKKYKEILGEDAGSLADFRQMKYNDPEEFGYTKGLKEYLEKYPTSDKRYYDAGEKLKALGIKKGVLLPAVSKQAFILPEGKHDPYHVMHRMVERNITDDEVRSYMTNARAMFSQWGGARQRFISDQGMAVVTKSGNDWIFKTAWKKDDYDDEALKILEVLKDVGL